MKKIDILMALLIGIIAAILTFFIFRFIGFKLPIVGEKPMALFIIFPIGAVIMIFIAWFLSKKMPVFFQITKCFLVGVLNTLIDLALLNLLIWLFMVDFAVMPKIIIWGIVINLLYAVFKGFSFSVATINAYFWNKYWTFEKKETKPGAKEFGTLYLITGIGFLFNQIISNLVFANINPFWGLTERMWASVAAIIATFFVFIWNFSGYKFIVFKK